MTSLLFVMELRGRGGRGESTAADTGSAWSEADGEDVPFAFAGLRRGSCATPRGIAKVYSMGKSSVRTNPPIYKKGEHLSSVTPRPSDPSNSNYDVSRLLSGFNILRSLDNLLERVTPVDHRSVSP